jgi:hypothetical protein
MTSRTVEHKRKWRTNASRMVKCQCCPYQSRRWYGEKGILVDPCPRCGSRMTYYEHWKGDQPVTKDEKL